MRFLLALLCAAGYSFATTAPTVIQDTLQNADGKIFSGTLYISWPTFYEGAQLVIAGTKTVPVTNGTLSTSLYPTDVSSPGGAIYTVKYSTSSGSFTEYWQVPTSGTPVPVSSCRTLNPKPSSYFSAQAVVASSLDYDFVPRSGNASLSGGVPASVALSSCPPGLTGDSTSSVYISGGTGTPESVIVTGLTGTSPSSSCTITFMPLYSHSGSYTISSATDGIQEAVNVLRSNGGGTVEIPTGVHNVYGSIRVATSSISFACHNIGSTVINQMVPNSTTISFSGSGQIFYNSIQGCNITDDVSTASGDVVRFSQCLQCTMRDSYIVGGYIGVHASNTFTLTLDNDYIFGYKFWGLIVDGSASTDLWVRGTTMGSANAGNGCVEINNLASGASFSQNDFFECGTVASMLVNPINSGDQVVGVDIFNTYFDTCAGPGLQIGGQGDTSLVHIIDGWANGNQLGVELATSGSGTITDFQWNGGRIAANGKWGVLLSGNVSQVSITNTQIGSNSTSNPNTFPDIDIGANISDVILIGNRIASTVGKSTNVSSAGIDIEAGSGDRILIQSNVFNGNTVAILNSATGSHNSIVNNIGYP